MDVLVITPVKDSVDVFERTARAVMSSVVDRPWRYVVYDDFSSEDSARRLDELAGELGFEVVHLSDVVDTPSPNYRYVLRQSQSLAIEMEAHLVIVESDVVVERDTVERLCGSVVERAGMVASVTVDDDGKVNFPYLYASKYPRRVVPTGKRLSFCCTLLSLEFLRHYSFGGLDPKKNWYDVSITRMARKLGFETLLDMTNRVRHYPHSSRPWKLLKYTNPWKYYWIKYTRGYDKI